MIKLKPMLEKIKTILKTPRYRLIILLIAFIIGLVWLKKSTQPETEPLLPLPKKLPSLPQIKEPEIKINISDKYSVQNIRFVGRKPEYPEELSLIEIENPQSIFSFCQAVAQNFGLKSAPIPEKKKESFGFWKREKTFLSCDKQKNFLLLSRPHSSGEKPQLEFSKEAVQLFTSQIGINLENFSLENENINYYQTDGGEYFPSLPEKAELISFNYQRKINSWPIFQFGTDLFPLEVIVGFNGSVVKVNYSPILGELKEKEKYPLIDIDQAINLLNQEKGKLISLEYKTDKNRPGYPEIPLDIKKIFSISLDQIQLVYLFSLEENFLIPSYIFSGTGTASDRKKVSLTILIPALPPQYFSQ